MQNPLSKNFNAMSQKHQISNVTGLVYHDMYLEHGWKDGHPEGPERLNTIMEQLEGDKLLGRLKRIAPVELERKWIEKIHDDDYLTELKTACLNGSSYIHSLDNQLCPASYSIALHAAGGVSEAIKAVMEGHVKNAFCAVRPPGHHAMRNRAMGFCFINNVAVGVRFLQEQYNIEKVLVVDWDLHHGNGTQAAFYNDPDVLFFSLHQFPFYPGSGHASETGEGPGVGFTVNVPMSPGKEDADYLQVFEDCLTPRALEFDPEFILISAGFDAHEKDPLGRMNLTREGFRKMSQIVCAIAQEKCKGRIVSVLEGGYDMQGLAESASAHVQTLIEMPLDPPHFNPESSEKTAVS